MMFKILYFAFVFAGGFQRIKSSQIFTLIRLRVYFPGVDAVLPGF